MPGMDGFEAIEILKADDRYSEIPVIFATGSYAVENAVKGFNLGAVDYVMKPYRNPAFIECIDKHLKAENDLVPLEMDNGYDNFTDKPIILAVDDSPDILKTVHAVLCDTYKIYTLPKPEKVEVLLQTIEPDLFLLDYKMPTLSGLDLIKIIRGLPEHQKTPIVFLTSDGSLDVITAAVAMGACDYIVKPFKSDVLREKITKHIMESRS
jgi:putative two-component system response regulator